MNGNKYPMFNWQKCSTPGCDEYGPVFGPLKLGMRCYQAKYYRDRKAAYVKSNKSALLALIAKALTVFRELKEGGAMSAVRCNFLSEEFSAMNQQVLKDMQAEQLTDPEYQGMSEAYDANSLALMIKEAAQRLVEARDAKPEVVAPELGEGDRARALAEPKPEQKEDAA